MRKKVRKFFDRTVDNSLSPCNYWLGRQDSNLRMAVPKTVVSACSGKTLVRNGAVIHKPESMGYKISAEYFGLNGSEAA